MTTDRAVQLKLALFARIFGRDVRGDKQMPDHEIFELGDVVLQSGLTLRQAKLPYKTAGRLAPLPQNVILRPTFYGGQHPDTEPMMAAGRALDPDHYFIVVPNMLGNGPSSSPSN